MPPVQITIPTADIISDTGYGEYNTLMDAGMLTPAADQTLSQYGLDKPQSQNFEWTHIFPPDDEAIVPLPSFEEQDPEIPGNPENDIEEAEPIIPAPPLQPPPAPIEDPIVAPP